MEENTYPMSEKEILVSAIISDICDLSNEELKTVMRMFADKKR